MNDPTLQRAALKREPNFQWLMRGGVISMLGDQLTMIALPWVVLKLTGDPLALGLVIALMAIPRAAFILIGGAIVDRYEPRRVFMLTKYASALLLGLLTLLILANQPGASLPLPFGDSTVTLALSPHATLMVVYVLAFGMGLAQAFGIPSGTSILPRALAPEFLQAANGMLMGLRQLTMLAGPLLAAALLYFGSDAHGLAFAFGFDCVSFLVSAWTLSHVRMRAAPHRPAENQSVFASIGAGLKMVWDDVPLRLCFFYWGLVTLLIGGSMQVALPLLANERLHGAAALGLLMGAHGAGTLIGMAGAAKGGALLGKNKISFGSMILLVDVIAGLLVAPLGMAQTTWQAMALLATLGLLTGFVQIAVFTWLQRRVPAHMMGRAMSIFMFIFVGLAPLSAAGAGWLLTLLTLQQMFAGGGLILVSLATAAYLFTPMRGITSAK